MKRLAIVALALAIGAPDASAQTAAQWSQLLAYVSKLAQRSIDQAAELERVKATLNTTIGALDQERCRVTRLQAFLVESLRANPVTPLTLVSDVACADLKSPVPPFPAKLP